MKLTDEEIMADYYAGKDEGADMIFNRYKNRILNFCLRVLGNRADAEDVTSDVFLAVFSKKYTHDPKAKFSTWIYTVARNGCISRIRKRKNLVSVWFSSKESRAQDQWDIPDNEDLSRDLLEKKEMAIRVRGVIKSLPHEQKEAIILREYHDLSYDQISVVLSCSLEKVKILIFRARESLRGDLSSFVEGGER